MTAPATTVLTSEQQTTRVYESEFRIRTLLDMARNNPQASNVKIAGSTFTISPDAIFSDISAVEKYVSMVCRAMTPTLPRLSTVPEVVENNRLTRHSRYLRGSHRIELASMQRSKGWAFRETVVLHELAHAASGKGVCHEEEFVENFITLTQYARGDQEAMVLRLLMYENGAL